MATTTRASRSRQLTLQRARTLTEGVQAGTVEGLASALGTLGYETTGSVAALQARALGVASSLLAGLTAILEDQP